MIPTMTYRIVSACSASIMLALQGHAQVAGNPDTLALRALNRTFRLLPIELSMDLSRGELSDSVPGLKAIGAGYDHVIWGRYQKGDSVMFSLSFRRDSAGGLFGGYLTRRARVESVEVSFSTNDASRAAQFLPQFRDATSELGPPQFCNRDTVAKDVARAVVLRATAIWRRGNVTVMLDMGMNAMNPVEKYRDIFRRFSVGYDAWRRSDTLHSGVLPTRHDSPCFFTEAEIRDRAVPLDSATYEAWRTRLPKAPP